MIHHLSSQHGRAIRISSKIALWARKKMNAAFRHKIEKAIIRRTEEQAAVDAWISRKPALGDGKAPPSHVRKIDK